MHLPDVTNLQMPLLKNTDFEPQHKNDSQSRDGEQAQRNFEVKSVPLDTLEDMQMEALKNVNSVNEALSLLRNLRDSSQISESAHERLHESLSKVVQALTKDKEAAASDSGKDYASKSPSERHDAEMADEAVPAATGIKAPKRKSGSRPFKPPSSKRQQLTSEEAAEIYSMRPEAAKEPFSRKGCLVNSMGKSKMIAPHFGVTAKTVRDIWHGRTWASATRHLWTDEEIAHRARGAVESDEEDKNASSGSASPTSVDSMKLHTHAQNLISSCQLSSLPALSSLKTQGMMGGMAGLPFQLSFPSATAPSAFAAHAVSVGHQPAALPSFEKLSRPPSSETCSRLPSYEMLKAAAQQPPMGFAGCHAGFGVGAHVLAGVPLEVSAPLPKM